MAFKQETKSILTIKREINNCSKERGALARYNTISRVETTMDIMKNKKEISGRGYGILIRYLKKKIPEEEPYYNSDRLFVRDENLKLPKRDIGKTQTIEELLSKYIND